MSKKPIFKIIGEDGNIFNLVGKASKCLKKENLNTEANNMKNEVFSSSSYEEALEIIGKYVEIDFGGEYE